ncbi:unnamed protein product [Angiostrongylus costaricensis]|uniref:BBS1 domain-containing protein n=1 Tax=Angiostrongylus costaricensis TaxID=334426 RepID=A0A0R3P9K8_ANGCS|nr:unnamed protein product [Angiostrongylus costaricensis]
MPKSTIDNLEVLVFGTERGMVFVVDSQAFQVIAECQISGVPVQIVTYGVFDVEYRCFVSTRNGNIFCVKRAQTVKEKPIISCKTDIVSFNILNKIVLATTDHMLFFYSFAGKCLNSIAIGESINGLEPFRYAPKQFEGILVLLENQIRLYTHLHLLDIIKTERSLSWMKFGQFGREEGALIVGTSDGGLFVKLFRRKASLDERVDLAAPPKPYNIKLNIPKKSKIFIDQTMRERENVNQINQVAFAEMSVSSADSISTHPDHSVDIAVTVNGFGPKFRLNVKLSCTTKTPLYNLWLSMVFSPSIYRFEQTLIPVSILMPGHFYTFTTLVECLEQEKVSISFRMYRVEY